eukprot:2373049-Pleurochrysis_carterae.AAC.5
MCPSPCQDAARRAISCVFHACSFPRFIGMPSPALSRDALPALGRLAVAGAAPRAVAQQVVRNRRRRFPRRRAPLAVAAGAELLNRERGESV